ncbi:MAG: hypothetical protein KDA31_14175 [Phycisphaerales bacterium]|nr:hypothetical protein [Phycisphaerales bacterium]MCB9837482.1 hypothetical protein [Phycisphaera sp.]
MADLKRRNKKRHSVSLACAGVFAVALMSGASLRIAQPELGPYIVVSQNDLGMHCMQRDYRYFMILPPYNTMQAVAIRRGLEPDIVEPDPENTVEYFIPSNTTTIDKTNWWVYSQALLGVDQPADVGLTGHALFGSMQPDRGRGLWEVTGVPISPMNDAGIDNPYPLATVIYKRQGSELARTQMVVPASWELNCALCHGNPEPGVNTELDVLQDHDRLHGTTLEADAPITCAACHADPALGALGQPGVSPLSTAMHGAHADRFDVLTTPLVESCYACHPGERAQCQRDVHLLEHDMRCTDCHGEMADVGDPGRQPWVDEPRCGDCHSRPGFEFEQPGTLFRNSVGHKGVQCWVCHGSPHAITPTTSEADNLQAVRLQGAPGVLSDCTVCHIQTPSEPFFHSVEH